MPFIFLSYSHKDSEYANRLADSLEAKGLEVWIDERIDYGATWPQAIEENLDRCAAFVVVMTPDAKQSKWVQNELAYAMGVDKPIFPVHLAGRLWLTVAATQVVSVTGGGLPPANFYSRLASILAAGHEEAAPTTSVRERLRAELDELQRRFDNLTSRIAAVDTDFGREMDGERRLTLDERRAELASYRDKTAVRMAQVEAQMEQLAKPAPAPVPVVEAEPAIKKPLSPIQTESQSAVKAAPGPAAPAALLTIDAPIRLELIRIPAGEFLMGDKKQRVDVAEFYIGKYPVTNAQYAAFVKAKSYDRPEHWKHGRIPAGKESHPVVNVSWGDAVAFCDWLSKATSRKFRLPSEAEWEKAARGGLLIPGPGGALRDNPLPARRYPWGDEFDKGKCNTVESGIGDTTPVGQYSLQGDSPYGVADLSGNVWEWCLNEYDNPKRGQLEGYALRVLRGSSWYTNLNFAAAPFRGRSDPDFRPHFVGFRVCAVLPPP